MIFFDKNSKSVFFLFFFFLWRGGGGGEGRAGSGEGTAVSAFLQRIPNLKKKCFFFVFWPEGGRRGLAKGGGGK